MTKRSLADLAAAFSKKTNEATETGANWKKFFPFWKADVGTTSKIRFLPDQDEKNSLGFLVQNITHTLEVNGRRETVACMKMYGESSCPVCEMAQKFYNEDDKINGKRFYRKLSYIGQVLVVDSPVEHDPEQLVKLIEFGPKIHKQILTAFQSGDLDNPPFEFEGGHDFRINKTQAGEFADYGTSSFAPKATNVSEDLIDKIELFNLADYRAPFVSREVLEGMIDSMLSGKSTAPARQASAPARTTTTTSTVSEAAPEAAGASTGEKKLSVAEQIRLRQAAKREANANAGADE